MNRVAIPYAITCTVAALCLAVPAAQARTPYRTGCHCVVRHAGAAHRRFAVARRFRAIPYVSVPRIPRYDPAEVWAEVHSVARYRTPYAYPAVAGPW